LLGHAREIGRISRIRERGVKEEVPLGAGWWLNGETIPVQEDTSMKPRSRTPRAKSLPVPDGSCCVAVNPQTEAKTSLAQTLLEKIQTLQARVEALEPGGDLEGLIEEGLNENDREVYQEMLAARERAASNEAAFPPSGVSALRQGANESGASEAARDPDTAR